MLTGGFLRMVLVALGAAGFAAAVLTAGFFAIGGGAFALANVASAFAAFAAVFAPQLLILTVWLAKSRDTRRAFALWAVKFSLIFLLMAIAARGLSALSMLAAPGFVFGVVAAIAVNLYMAAKMTMQVAPYNKRV